MKLFSEREGLKRVRTEIQVDSVDKALRNRLWNVLTGIYWEEAQVKPDLLTLIGESNIHLKCLDFCGFYGMSILKNLLNPYQENGGMTLQK